MKRLIIIIALFVLMAGKLPANPDELLQQANEAYTRSEFGFAIELYEQILDMGYTSAELYYNLGNAYFRNNLMGAAILNYERALRMDPNNDDIRHNLAVARSRIVDRVESPPELFYERWWKLLWNMQSADGWAITSIVVIVLFLATTSLYLFSRRLIQKKAAFYSMLLLFLVAVFSLIFARKQYNRLTSGGEAIIMQTRVTAKSSPSNQSGDLFLIHEGTKVNIRNILGEWREISLPDGSVGWIKEETMEII
ncbi:MAG: tetratricopeptide repeat protein [Bacteroidota bacterium]